MRANNWLKDHLGDEYFSGNFDHLKNIIHKLDLQVKNSKVITIAGTNGKGQTSRLVTSALSKQNKTHGLWTSPHLVNVKERYFFNNEFISDDQLIEYFEQLKIKLADEFKTLSYFEFLFLTFLSITSHKNPEFIILEVGLGGRLDATNAIDADLACVVSIARDHQHLLGKTYKSILMEKLAISRKDRPLVTAFEMNYLQNLAQKYTEHNQVIYKDLFRAGKLSKSDDFEIRNKVLAQSILEFFDFELNLEELGDEFSSAKRKLLEHNGSVFEFFPTHNLDGLRKLVQFLKQRKYNNYDLVMISFSNRELADLRAMNKIIKNFFQQSQITLVHFDHFKSLEKGKLLKLSDEFDFKLISDIKTAKQEVAPNSKVLITGSNYFIGDFIQQFSREK